MRFYYWAAILILFSCDKPVKNDHPEKPNFLFLFADDLTFDGLNSLGNDEIKTPNLDALKRRGFTFTHAFNQGSWSGAVCVVSRAMLACGRYIYHARDDINTAPLWGEVMGQSGYKTFMTGKWHNGHQTVYKSFQTAKSVGAGMYETKGGMQGPGYHRPVVGEEDFWSPYDTTLLGHWFPKFYDIVTTDTGKVTTPEYRVHRHTSEIYADNAIEFLNEQKGYVDQPFFMYVAFNAPHDPRQAPKEFLDMYPLDEVAVPDNYLPEHPFDQGEKMTLRDELLAPIPRTEYAVKKHRQEYYAIITHLDQQIGRILEALERNGQANNTYIIFTADHGLAVGKHGLLGKQNQYDHSIRVPMIIVGPDIPQDRTSDELVYLQSAFPTTCELAGITPPSDVEFRSVLPIIKQGQSGETAIFGSYKDYQRMVRTKEYKLILYPEVHQNQLFKLSDDPLEMHNAFDNSDNAPIIQSLYKQLTKLQEEVGDTLRITLPSEKI
ncbi:MAG: sulfatase-like hydrolase/transferase [Saprospiraceae bacterium]|nr:sulfatase-like hydrolase/transferase [Saprospiraceae bacterium]